MTNDSNSLYLIILGFFLLAFIFVALYFLYLYIKSLTCKKESKSINLSKTKSIQLTERSLSKELIEEIGQINNQQSPQSSSIAIKMPTAKEPNLEPAPNASVSSHELRSIIASKLKPPPSTLDRFIEHKDDIEIKQELDNDDIFSVISTKSIERYRISRPSKFDKLETNTETTESEQQDKVIVLKSGVDKKASRSSSANKSKRSQSRSSLKKIKSQKF